MDSKMSGTGMAKAREETVQMRWLLARSDGQVLEVSEDVWDAFEFMRQTKRNGSVTVEFKSGGIAGVIAATRFK